MTLPSPLLLHGENNAAHLLIQDMVAIGMQSMDALLAENVSALILRKGEDDLITDALKAHVISCMDCSHRHPLPLKRKAHPLPAPFAPLAAEGESAGCREYADNCKSKIGFTKDSCAVRESIGAQSSVWGMA